MKKLTQKLSFIAMFVALTACTTTNVDLHSEIELPTSFEQTQSAVGFGEVSQWWKNWNDAQLTGLIEQGLQNNLDVAIARARLAEAQANTEYTEADKGPTVSGVAGAGASRSQIRDNPLSGENYTSSGNSRYAGITASWELDFFGKKRSDADAASALEMSAQDQVHAAQMLVASEIGENYFNIFAIQQKSAILKQYEATLRHLKNYVQGRFNAGQANANDVLLMESRLSSVQAQQATLNSQMANSQRTIAVLIGKTPQGFSINKSVNPLVQLPKAPAGSMPGDVLERRPDLHSYRNQVQAYAAKLASAKADLYPRFDIQFLGGTGRIDLTSDLSDLKGWTGMLSGGITLPIFTNGRIQANINAADARLKAALLQYDKALLQALADVDNSYQAQYELNNQLQLLQTASRQAQSHADNAEKLFRYDEQTLDNALSARLTALDYQQQVIQTRLSAAQNLIGLYKSLGGGWHK